MTRLRITITKYTIIEALINRSVQLPNLAKWRLTWILRPTIAKYTIVEANMKIKVYNYQTYHIEAYMKIDAYNDQTYQNRDEQENICLQLPK